MHTAWKWRRRTTCRSTGAFKKKCIVHEKEVCFAGTLPPTSDVRNEKSHTTTKLLVSKQTHQHLDKPNMSGLFFLPRMPSFFALIFILLQVFCLKMLYFHKAFKYSIQFVTKDKSYNLFFSFSTSQKLLPYWVDDLTKLSLILMLMTPFVFFYSEAGQELAHRGPDSRKYRELTGWTPGRACNQEIMRSLSK